MSYWLYLPKNVPAKAATAGVPLIVMLHGCQQSATQFAQGTRMNQLAEKKGFAVLYPQQLVSSQAHRCWRWFDRAVQEGGGETAMIAGMIEQVLAQHPVDRRRVYVCGISAGAGMANIIALNRPDLIAAVGLHSGPVYGGGHSTIGALGVMQHGAGMRVEHAIHEVMARKPDYPAMPTLLIQGLDDKVVRPVNQSQLVRQTMLLNRIGADIAPRVTLKPGTRNGSRNRHEIRDFVVGRKVMLRVAQVSDLDHAWSGGDPELKYHAKAGPDASKMMLDFFARHSRKPVSAASARRGLIKKPTA
ncbi:PHB depolymerase family esterase [Oxalobacteraceae bacterium]|nr:PHB depolymerase family esterase [Oxalobacteraceae bacterium]